MVANTTLDKSYFAETVILMIEHGDLGSFGIILNRINEMQKNLADIILIKDSNLLHTRLNKEELTKRMRSMPLYKGGPVDENALFFVHNDASLQDPGEEILPNIFWGSKIELLQDLLDRECPVNVYRGYAGWGIGQLEQEIKTKSWIVLPASDEIIFHDDHKEIYRKTLKNGGDLYLYFADKVRNPLLN